MDQVAVGDVATVLPGGITSDLSNTTARRLLHQGLVSGARVEVLQRTTGSGRIVSLGRTRVALDPSVAQGIPVEVDKDQGDSS